MLSRDQRQMVAVSLDMGIKIESRRNARGFSGEFRVHIITYLHTHEILKGKCTEPVCVFVGGRREIGMANDIAY